MEKRKRWHLWLIVGVLALTVYSILPTLFFYAKPLDKPVGEKTATQVTQHIVQRVDAMEGESVAWLKAFAKNLKVKPSSIALDETDPKLIRVRFKKESDARFFERILPRAGAMIPFAPAQLQLSAAQPENEVVVQRLVSTQLDDNFFTFATKDSPLYQDVLQDRVLSVTRAVEAKREFDQAEFKRAFGASSAVLQRLNAGDNPFISKVFIDSDGEQMVLALYPDVEELLQPDAMKEEEVVRAELAEQLLIDEIAYVSQASGEQISPNGREYVINLNELVGAGSYLLLDLAAVAKQESEEILGQLREEWQPSHPDFARENFFIEEHAAYAKLPVEQRNLGLLVYAPAMEEKAPPSGFRPGSLYVVARGVGHIVDKGGETSELAEDFQNLRDILVQNGFFGYPGSAFGMESRFKNDYVFELSNFYADLIGATREDFTVRGTKRWAVLDFSTEKQRLLTTNEIETAVHEDLLKWRDDYQAAQVSMRPDEKYLVPAPNKNVLLDNLKLSTRKYFRGDERKVLGWGLDLSGGKSVTIGLRDFNNRPVTNPADIRQGINELHTRVNKMGVSEVEIRQEGDNIVLNFPGAQGLSASELIKASTMSFHIVNEKFTPRNQALGESVARFLQEVWNEAVVTNRTDLESINRIAFRHRSESAELLRENGLQLADPETAIVTGTFDDSVSMIGKLRGESYSEWNGQPNPLTIVFSNYALEGTNLESVQAQYDPAKGNKLVFSVKSGARGDFYSWTSQFAEERIVGTPKELYSGGKGWRMAIVLNGSIVSAPQLVSPLKGNGEVTGNFSQREINQLVADLKAGSLSFTPKILSEKNVSPELGQSERTQGISAIGAGLFLVILMMLWYYRFAGLVAGCAVVFNLLIMWGALQSIDAALTLAGIAGIILTIGMAVDANVLVFERVREEFAISGRIGSAIQAGYRKAFSAIIDSNVTTIIAAFILLQFDAGPIKAFAVTLIIGIISSMFTALFMTRYFFAGWVQNPNHKELKMRNLFKNTNFDFLSKARVAITVAIAVIIVGMALLVMQSKTMFGMDFTGGYALNVTLEEEGAANYSSDVLEALAAAGAPSADIQVRTLNRANQLRIQLGMGMEQAGRPFYDMPQEIAAEGAIYAYENNPRIDWVVHALAAGGLDVKPDTLVQLDSHWSAMSGQFSDTMRNQAVWGLGLALLSILLYITIRFEFKYAVSACLALAHDLLITVGMMAILHWIGVPLQIDLQVIGALMTIVGYSLNDTIVIFDRIREDGRLMRKLSFPDLINRSLNRTLNRTLITSGTTLMVLFALDFFGGRAVFGFSLVMTMGVIFGTFSSLFIASPVLLYFHNREGANEQATPKRA